MYKKLDIPYCRKVLEFAEDVHEDFRHNQMTFYTHNECTTSACMGGIACLLAPNVVIKHVRGCIGRVPVVDGTPESWVPTATKLMGLTEYQAQHLFYDTLQQPYPEGAACDLLRHYIEAAEKERANENRQASPRGCH
jgi:hypothetical protein